MNNVSTHYWNEDPELSEEIRRIIQQTLNCARYELEENKKEIEYYEEAREDSDYRFHKRKKPKKLKPNEVVHDCITREETGFGQMILINGEHKVKVCGRILWFRDCKDATLIKALEIAAKCKKNPPKAFIFLTTEWKDKMQKPFGQAKFVARTLGVQDMTWVPTWGLQ